jgi:hypothetical protein
MFDQVLENLRKSTEANVQMQQEMFRKWIGLWSGVPASGPFGWPTMPTPPVFGTDPAQRFRQFQDEWTALVKDVNRRHAEALEASFKVGLQNIEKAVQLGEVRTVDELRARTVELWQTCFDCLRKAYELPLREFQAVTEKWLQLVAKTAA